MTLSARCIYSVFIVLEKGVFMGMVSLESCSIMLLACMATGQVFDHQSMPCSFDAKGA